MPTALGDGSNDFTWEQQKYVQAFSLNKDDIRMRYTFYVNISKRGSITNDREKHSIGDNMTFTSENICDSLKIPHQNNNQLIFPKHIPS